MSGNADNNQHPVGKRIPNNLKKALNWARQAIAQVIYILAVLENVVGSFNTAGQTVAAGAGLVSLNTATVKGTGTFLVQVWATGTFPAGHVTAIAGAAQHGHSIPTAVAFEQNTTQQLNIAASYIFASGFAKGTQVDFAFTTTVGDQVVTLGNGSTGSSAGMIITEIA